MKYIKRNSKISHQFVEDLKYSLMKKLSKNERILSVSLAKTTNSVYISLIDLSTHRYLQFRVSNHKSIYKTSARKTIMLNNYPKPNDIAEEIIHKKETMSWMNIDYHLYFTLYLLAYYRPKNVSFVGKFGKKSGIYNLTGIAVQIFVGKALAEDYQVKGPIFDVMKKMLTQGLLDYDVVEDKVLYVTTSGFAILHQYMDIYHERLKEDLIHIDLKKLELPSNNTIIQQKDLLISYRDVCIGKYFIYALRNLETEDIEYINYTKEDVRLTDLLRKNRRDTYEQLCKENLKLAQQKKQIIEPLIIMTHLTKKEAEATMMSLLNFSSLMNQGEIRHIRHIVKLKERYRAKINPFENAISADGEHIKQLSTIEYVTSKLLKNHQTLIVKVNCDHINVMPNDVLNKKYDQEIAQQTLNGLNISMKNAEQIKFIIGINEATGEVVSNYYIFGEPEKEENTNGKTKYKYYFQKVSTPCKFPVKNHQNKRLIIKDYAFVNAQGEMKVSNKRTTYINE